MLVASSPGNEVPLTAPPCFDNQTYGGMMRVYFRDCCCSLLCHQHIVNARVILSRSLHTPCHSHFLLLCQAAANTLWRTLADDSLHQHQQQQQHQAPSGFAAAIATSTAAANPQDAAAATGVAQQQQQQQQQGSTAPSAAWRRGIQALTKVRCSSQCMTPQCLCVDASCGLVAVVSSLDLL
jgi:hypothetical protein